MRRLGFVLGLLLVLAGPAVVWAHPYLERAEPAPFSVIERAPASLRLRLTERPEPRLTEVAVFDAAGAPVALGPLTQDPTEARVLHVELEPLPDGVYTVAWRALSAEDGHSGAGVFAFAVGPNQPTPTSADLRLPPGSGFGAPPPTLLAVVSRWLSYAGAIVLAGGVLCLGTILLPTLPGGLPPVAIERLRNLLVAALLAVAVGALTGLMVQALEIGSEEPAQLRLAVLDLLSTRSGPLLGGRLLAAGLAALGLWRLLQSPPSGRPRGLTLLLVAGSALLMLQALGSHAAASARLGGLAVPVQWSHLLAMSAWLGGLLFLTTLGPAILAANPPERAEVLRRALFSRFSRLAIPSVAVVLLSGLLQSWLFVGSPDELAGTEYGRTLLAKLLLVVSLLGLGYLHLTRYGRPERAAGQPAVGPSELPWLTLRMQLGLAALVLLVTGLLANLPPARDAPLDLQLPPAVGERR